MFYRAFFYWHTVPAILMSFYLFTATPKPIHVGGKNIKVIVVLTADCPISRYYTLVLNQLSLKYGKYCTIQAIFPYPENDANEIWVFKHKYRFYFDAVQDTFHHKIQSLNATVTPEVIVFENAVKKYQGAIDDAYTALGKHGVVTKNNYLSDALDALISNRPVKTAYVKPVGCLINNIMPITAKR
jgi:hypothetical protein